MDSLNLHAYSAQQRGHCFPVCSVEKDGAVEFRLLFFQNSLLRVAPELLEYRKSRAMEVLLSPA